MPTNPFDIIEPVWRSFSHLEYGHWMVSFGEALEKHEDHQGENAIPPPLAGPAQLKEVGNLIIALSIAAQDGDHNKAAERDAYRPKSDLQVSGTVNWVAMRSVLEDRPSIRGNLPLEEKKHKKPVRSSGSGFVTAPTNLKVKRSDEHSGIVYLSVERIPLASMYFAQYCQGDPTDEASWTDGGQSDSCRKIEVKGLKPGEVYHFRVRCFGGGQYSPWSHVVTIRIL
jgi:hypothetical protein